MKIDGIDKKIIRSLVKDARTPILSIARDIGISGAAIHQRLRKLEKSDLIDGYYMKINSKSLGYSLLVKVFCKDDLSLMKLLDEKIKVIKGVKKFETFVSLNQQIDRQLHI